ncbi:transcriptional repressor LexA [Castellaniella denitrificans]|uniref:LexA repressor n=1 Tax=Castellaniella denitrificans TaxID=56119 RepID=A0ABT4M8P6_9BURK|nr:transcriptional repressor LexA [Castellaniella denitrificans]MCZ4330840.1 transcriptional repressor LexA [Castellaniella denitrificans]
MALKLTARQSQILDIIRLAIQQTGRPPTRAEIARQLGFRSANAAEDHLRALERKGYIHLSAATSRGIQLTGQALAAAADADPAVPEGATAHAGGRPTAPPGAPTWIASSDSRLVPLVGRVAAGSPVLAAEHVEREIPLAPHLFDAAPDYLLRVRGSSMRDAGILDGDLLAVRSTPQARHGQIVVARLGDDVTVKRLEHQGRRIRLLPENPDFQPIDVGPGDDFAIEGIAVGLIRTTPLH